MSSKYRLQYELTDIVFEFIKTVKHSDIKPKPDIAYELYDLLYNKIEREGLSLDFLDFALRDNRLRLFENIKKTTDTPPTKEFADKLYRYILRYEDRQEIGGLIGIVDWLCETTLSPEIVQEAYRRSIRNADYYRIASTYNETKITPSEEVISAGFEYCAEKMEKCEDYTDWQDLVKLLMKISKKKPDAKVMQRAYLGFLENSRINSIRRLIHVTNINPCLPSEAVQRAYKRCIEEEYVSTINEIQELTKIKPAADIIQDGFEHYVAQKKFKLAKRLQEVTGKKPNIATAQRAYQKQIRERFEKLPKIKVK